jgi:hypothetical protein
MTDRVAHLLWIAVTVLAGAIVIVVFWLIP